MRQHTHKKKKKKKNDAKKKGEKISLKNQITSAPIILDARHDEEENVTTEDDDDEETDLANDPNVIIYHQRFCLFFFLSKSCRDRPIFDHGDERKRRTECRRSERKKRF